MRTLSHEKKKKPKQQQQHQKALANVLEALDLTPVPHKKERYKTFKDDGREGQVVPLVNCTRGSFPQLKSGQQQVQNPTSAQLCNQWKGHSHIFSFQPAFQSLDKFKELKKIHAGSQVLHVLRSCADSF